MKHLLFLMALSPISGLAQSNPLLERAYTFFVSDGEMTRYEQRADTLYQWHGIIHYYPDYDLMIKKRSRVIKSLDSATFTVLDLESLDSIPLTTNPYPDNRFSMIAVQAIGTNRIGITGLKHGLTRDQLDSIQVDFTTLPKLFYFTYFSDDDLVQFRELNDIETKADADRILALLETDETKARIERYQATGPHEMYYSGISAELIHNACITLGYNPIGAIEAIGKLTQ